MATIRVFDSFDISQLNWWWIVPLTASSVDLGGRVVEPFDDSQTFEFTEQVGSNYSSTWTFDVAGDGLVDASAPRVEEIDLRRTFTDSTGSTNVQLYWSVEGLRLSLDDLRAAMAQTGPAAFQGLLREQLRGDDVVYMGRGYGNVATYEGNDLIYVGTNGGTFDAGAGDDTIDGRSNGFGDVDEELTFIGGGGDDTFIVTSPGVRVVEDKAGGIDLLQIAELHTGMKYVMAANVENAQLINLVATNVTGNGAGNIIKGNAARNALYGAGGSDKLAGLGGDDVLHGGNGADVLYGGPGRDKLTGGSGADRFVFDSKLDGVTNRDIVTDFTPGLDRLVFSAKVFGGLGVSGGVPGGAFRSGSGTIAAQDADDRLVYDTTSGLLRFDKDGLGGVAAIVVAQLGIDSHPALSAGDLLIVA